MPNDINVPVNHILAKLALSIANVPADIASVTLTLGNASKTFTLDGNFAEDGNTTTWRTLANQLHYSYTETPWAETVQ